MTIDLRTTSEVEVEFGRQVRALRLALDIDQVTLANNANVGVTPLRRLEAGRGSSLRTVVRVARALDRADWLLGFYPEPEISPLALARALDGSKAPTRASSRRRRADG